MTETRFNMLWHTHPDEAEKYLKQAQQEVNQRYHYYKQLSELKWGEQTTLKSAHAKVVDEKNIKGES